MGRNDTHLRCCENCDKDFHGRSAAKFCSHACVGESQRIRPVAKCETCGKRFQYVKSQRTGRFCSHRCWQDIKSRPRLSIEERKWSKDPSGYLALHKVDHPMSSGKSRHLRQHWYVLYESSPNKSALVQLKDAGATIHHRNGKRDDNRIENLELRLRGQHPKGTGQEDAILLLKALGYTVSK